MTVVHDDSIRAGLAIVERFEAFVTYLYPIVQRSPQHHRVLRDEVLHALFRPIGEIYHAAKSRQVSRLHAIDASFATLRAYMRFLASPTVRILNGKQHAHALHLLHEPGSMLNAWMRRLKDSGMASAPRSKGQAGS